MLRKRIMFSELNKAELVGEQIQDVFVPNQVLVKTAYSTRNPDTERTNITADPK